DTEFVLIDNDGTDTISGTFTGLPEGSLIVVGTYVFQLSYLGGDGNDVALTSLVPNRMPVAHAGGPYVVDEGNPITFDAQASSDPDADPLQYRWDFDNDGTWDTAWSNSATTPHTWSDDHAGSATLEVFDGIAYATATTTVTVRNVAPILINVTTTSPIHEGQSSTLSGTISDPSTADTFTLNINWGDPLSPGNTQSLSFGNSPINSSGVTWDPITRVFTVSHQYLDDNPSATLEDRYSIGLWLADDDGGHYNFVDANSNLIGRWAADGDARDSANGHDGTLNGGMTFVSGVSGQAFHFDGSNDYVSVPDSIEQRAAMFTVAGWVQFANQGSIVLASKYGGYYNGWILYLEADRRASMSVYNVSNPALGQNVASSPLPGSGWTHVAGTYDGTNLRIYVNGEEQGTARFDGGYLPTGQAMTLGRASWYPRDYFAGDLDDFRFYDRALTAGEIAAIVSPLTTLVCNVAPTATLTNNGPKNEGSPVTVSFTNQSDPGTLDTFTYSFDWNNDGIYDIVDQTSPSASHTWPDNGSYMIKGRIKDDDGGFSEYTTPIIVANVAPTSNAGADQTVNAGDTVLLSGAFSDPGTADTHTFLWHLVSSTNGQSIPNATTQNLGFIPTGPGVYTFTFRVTDDDGGTNIDTVQVTAYPPHLVVDTTTDENDGNWMAGDLSLREAIAIANARSGADTITFSPALTYGGPATLRLNGTELVIASTLTITGPGADLLTLNADSDDDGIGDSRIFSIDDGNSAAHISVELVGLTLTKGTASKGGAIYNREQMTLRDSTLVSNSAIQGGGIVNEYESKATLINSTLINNAANFGGGLLNGSYSTVTLTNSTLTGNVASEHGGAIYNSSIGTARVINSTVAGNSANRGGGIDNDTLATLTLINSTLANNAANHNGGGIRNLGSVFVANTIVASNATNGSSPDVDGAFTSHGNNLIGNTINSSGWLASDLLNVSPMLGSLGNYGGLTQTIPLLVGSPAIDAGDNSLAIDEHGQPLTSDQRGVGYARELDADGDSVATVDIGAFEYAPLFVTVDVHGNLVITDSFGYDEQFSVFVEGTNLVFTSTLHPFGSAPAGGSLSNG
ncbi:MAG: LamG-like jellyroll fold domain-containing protein, partial [Planctomycetota bacterium]